MILQYMYKYMKSIFRKLKSLINTAIFSFGLLTVFLIHKLTFTFKDVFNQWENGFLIYVWLTLCRIEDIIIGKSFVFSQDYLWFARREANTNLASFVHFFWNERSGTHCNPYRDNLPFRHAGYSLPMLNDPER